jgi:hypothetical protein
MVDTSSHQELTDKSNSGTLKDIANILLKSTITAIGFQRSDLSPLLLRLQLPEDNTLLLLDGMDILKSGTTKLSTLRIH